MPHTTLLDRARLNRLVALRTRAARAPAPQAPATASDTSAAPRRMHLALAG